MLLKTVKDQLSAVKNVEKSHTDLSQIDIDFSSFQELYELRQQKFLGQISNLTGKMQTVRQYTRLVSVEKHKIQALQDISSCNCINNTDITDTQIITELMPCLRALCEAEDGWHLSSTFMCLKDIKPDMCSYLARVMNILQSGNTLKQLNIFCTEQGSQLIKDIENKALVTDIDVGESFIKIRQLFIEQYESGNVLSFDMFIDGKVSRMSLKKCEMKNHKILWLCNGHIDSLNPKVLSDSDNNTELALDEANYMILKELENINLTEF